MKKIGTSVRIVGWVGTSILIVTYALNSFGMIESQSFWYPALNLISAILLGIRVFVDRNYSNLILEMFWAIVAIITLFNYFF